MHFKALHLLEAKPDLTQPELAREHGISLGGANYCLKALIDIGHIKAKNSSQHPKKIAYMYLLTPEGVASKLRLTAGFLKRKLLLSGTSFPIIMSRGRWSKIDTVIKFTESAYN